MTLSIIIISYNTCDLMRNCLASLAAYPPACEYAITVVDNASADDTVAMIRREFPGAGVIANDANLGYAAAINQGLRQGSSDLVLILNSDIEVREGELDTLLGFMAATPEAGMCAPQLVLPDGRPQPTWRRGFTLGHFPRQQLLLDKLSHRRERPTDAEAEGTPREVEHLDGAALLVRRAAIEAVGLMDEGYWMYCEDSDFCQTFRAAGWSLVYVPDATMLHVLGGSSKTARAEMIAAYNHGACRYFGKHHGPAQARSAKLIGLAGGLLRLALWGVPTVLTLGLVGKLRKQSVLFAKTVWLTLQPPRRPVSRKA